MKFMLTHTIRQGTSYPGIQKRNESDPISVIIFN